MTLDRRFYYSKSSPVKVFTGELDIQFEIGKIESFDDETDVVKVCIKNSDEIRTVSCNNVCRIL